MDVVSRDRFNEVCRQRDYYRDQLEKHRKFRRRFFLIGGIVTLVTVGCWWWWPFDWPIIITHRFVAGSEG